MPTILLVDDQPMFRENLAEALEDHGFDVLQAVDASQALLLCQDPAQPPDLFLLDIALPGTNGLELLERLRNQLGAYRVPALFLTAYPHGNLLEESRRLGASDFFVKADVSLQDLLARIEHRLDPTGTTATATRTPFRPSTIDNEESDENGERKRHLRPSLRRWRPSSPRPSINRLFALACKQEINKDDLLALAQLDPVIDTTLHEATASGPFRLHPPAPGAEAALDRLGTVDAMHLLLSRAVIDLAGKGVPPRGDLVRLWGHAIATGLFAERLAQPSSFPSRQGAFLAGLCSELPTVFGILALEEDYAEVRAQAWEEGIPIQTFLADVFETTPAHLALECAKALELPEPLWKAVVDLQSGFTPTSLWEPGPASRILDGASLLALGQNLIWNPCVPIRTISCEEAQWWNAPGELERDLPHIAAEIDKLVTWGDILPELGGQTQAIPSGAERRFLYLRSATVFQPDPIEALLHRLGEVEVAEDPERLARDDEAVRVAAVEPSTPLWNRLLEIPRRTILLHRGLLPPELRMGPHTSMYLPATVAALESLLRPR